ncbi:methionine synthase [Oscillospiraceae bacterium MB08-C2-2]|nr:methionine synthase [Oscillospiraceae bacterium MB08-C2-2]
MNIQIDRAEVLRYLGYGGQELDEALSQLIDSSIADCLAWAKPAYTHRTFGLVPAPGGIGLAGTSLILAGESIAKHLEGAKGAVLMAATLGLGLENQLKRMNGRDMTRSLIVDSAATDCIEKVCDLVEEEIRQEQAAQGLSINFRFSPGYGDLPLETQPAFLSVLDAGRRIGLTCTSNLIMLPRKSVTAIMGIFENPAEPAPKSACSTCNLAANCPYRKSGKSCGHR